MSHLDTFNIEERDALDLLAATFRALRTTPITNVHMDNPGVLARGLHSALGATIASEPMRRELARRTYVSLIERGGVPPASGEDIVRTAYHDRDAQWRWSAEVIKWAVDLCSHLQDEASQPASTH